MRPNYTIIRCFTTDKSKVMDLLNDANEYKIVRDHVDGVYYNGDSPNEKAHTQLLVENNIKTLIANNIWSETNSNLVDDWFFISKPC